MYFVNSVSIASRDGIGVNFFEFREKGLQKVLRPKVSINHPALVEWFTTVQNQKYDWFGLLRFAWVGDIPTGNNNKMFCSEFLVRAYRAAGMAMFGKVNADAIAPWMFELLDNFEDITHLIVTK
jgi:hypothetical protein